jgi:hypothetical protein
VSIPAGIDPDPGPYRRGDLVCLYASMSQWHSVYAVVCVLPDGFVRLVKHRRDPDDPAQWTEERYEHIDPLCHRHAHFVRSRR